MRNIFSAAICVALTAPLAFAPVSVSAHSEMETTMPSNGATMGDVPENVSFDFTDEVRLTEVVMTHKNHPSVDLDLSGQKTFSRQIDVPVIGMGDGPYRFEWRGLDKDGHAMQGSFTFNVK
ncbi:MAG: copper resistance protein CopC [Rhodobacterales bacterium]|nr:copper resistance protein CopC [Rhodobacterales bacterium]